MLLNELEHIEDVNRTRLGTGLKFYLGIDVNMSKLVGDDAKVTNFQNSASTLLQTSNIQQELIKYSDALVDKIDKYLINGSGWVVDSVESMNIMMTKYNPIGAGTYIKLPAEISL